jgi:acetyltransferase
MGPHYLNPFFVPRSVAIVGATDRPHSVGQRLMINMQEAGFAGRLYPVNPKHKRLLGLDCYADIDALPEAVDLAVIATPAGTVPAIIRQCGEKGTRAAVIISAGFGELGETGHRLQQEVLETAGRYGMRIVGPNCLGIIRPSARLNATFGYGTIGDGHLALVSQSGAVCTAILDWAQSQDIGFSTVVSMGDAADIDFGEVLDFLALDPQTKNILLYVEGTRAARSFLSGLKAAARLKPVILIKAGRHEAGSRAAMSHTGAMVGADDVFDAAIERAGVVRTYSIAQLFSAARIMANAYTIERDRLAIITNAGGPGVMSADRAEEVGVTLADLSEETMAALNAVLPEHWSHANPIDILGDATPERYRQVLEICLKDEGIDGTLVILTPQAMTDPARVAQFLVAAAKGSSKPVMASWTGGKRVEVGRALFADEHIAHFTTPEVGVDAFSFLARYKQNQRLVQQIPLPREQYRAPDIDGARLIIERVLAEGRDVLTAQESKAILSAFHVPVTPTVKVGDTKEAMMAAETLGFPVVLKINMAEFSHKSDIGGVRLNLASAQQVARQFQELEAQVRQLRPQTERVEMTVEPMHRSASSRELMVGVVRDPVFGPAVSFGLGGTMVEILQDRAVALPPLNSDLAEQLIAKTRASRYIAPFRQMPGIDRQALIETLLSISEMVSELPEIMELDINPLIADEHGVMAVDARIRVAASHQLTPYAHMAIHPYPLHLARQHQLPNGMTIQIRPIRPEDASMEKDFFNGLSERSKFFRFRKVTQELTPEMVIRFTQIDYDREMAFVAINVDESLPREMGVASYITNPDGESADYAVVVADACQRMGIGARLMRTLISTAKDKGILRFEGEVSLENKAMLSLVKQLGFTLEPMHEHKDIVRAVLLLRQG